MPDEKHPSLLVEIGTEELPPSALRKLAASFAANCTAALQKVELITPGGNCKWFATPRRIAVRIPGVAQSQPEQTITRRGPALAAAFDDAGNPTAAALGFAKSCDVNIDSLQRTSTEKGEWLSFTRSQSGQPAATLVPGCIEQAIQDLPIPKRMRWGELQTEFVRPVHWLVILHGETVVDARILSVQSGRVTRGHRFHCPHPLEISDADSYEQLLQDSGFVVADFELRKGQIKQQAIALAADAGGSANVDNESLLEEVTGLVEWPVGLMGSIDAAFLEMPAEVLVSSMRDHQKYFSVFNDEGELLPNFITISNIESRSPDRVRQGNEKVLSARLSDARFFWDSDRKIPLEQHGARLSQVLFHRKLGTVADKISRLEKLVTSVAPACGADSALCARATQLVKADLVTDMVGEFPELQGVMGYYYALHDGEDDAVAAACSEHYLPRFAGDTLPANSVATAIALIDRVDSLVGIFGAGEAPKADKDPYALRRGALGLLRILIEGDLDLDLRELLDKSADVYRQTLPDIDLPVETIDRLQEFIMDRLQGYYMDQEFGSDVFAAVAATSPSRPADFDHRLRAVAKFRQHESAPNLSAANKRIRNILRKASDSITEKIDPSLFTDTAEINLARELDDLEERVKAEFEAGQYENGLELLASLRGPVDCFFDEVMVMVEDENLRLNRLALLRRLQQLFLQVADVSLLQESSQIAKDAA